MPAPPVCGTPLPPLPSGRFVLRARRPSWSPPPPPPAPVLGLLLRATDCAKQPLDGLVHLFADEVTDHADEIGGSWHQSPLPGERPPLRGPSPPGQARSNNPLNATVGQAPQVQQIQATLTDELRVPEPVDSESPASWLPPHRLPSDRIVTAN